MAKPSRIKVKIDAFKKAIIIIKFKAGDVIFRQGEIGQVMFVVRKGKVELRLGGKVLDTIVEEETFGELALIDQRPRSASAVAATDCELVPIDCDRFILLVEQRADFALLMLRVVAARLRNMDDQFAIMSPPVPQPKPRRRRPRKRMIKIVKPA
jgi:CRP-like cAMP-binding protein